jgi:hypothetical protein
MQASPKTVLVAALIGAFLSLFIYNPLWIFYFGNRWVQLLCMAGLSTIATICGIWAFCQTLKGNRLPSRFLASAVCVIIGMLEFTVSLMMFLGAEEN